MPQAKVMIIGMDAATLDLVRPWVDQGLLPNLKRFMEKGAWGELLSTLPVISSCAWSTFATGVNPGKHGILDFCQLLPDSYTARFINASVRRGSTFWEIAARHGVKGGIMNVPVTYPPRPYDGFLVSCMLSPGVNRRITTPPELFDDLMAFAPNYGIDIDVTDTGTADMRDVFFERSMQITQARLNAAVGLYRKYRPPLFCCVFISADRICHYFWSYHEALASGRAKTDKEKRLGEAIRLTYEKLDACIGTLVAEAGIDTDVLILSDHGAGPRRRGLNMRKLLAQAGLLKEYKMSPLARLSKWGIETFARIASTSLKAKIKTRFAGLTTKAATVVACSGIDFARTQAYPTGDSAGVFVNLKGRQPRGTVQPGAEYEAVRDKIIDVLKNLTDPQTGQQVALNVYRREEAWSGPMLERLPDVIMEQKDLLYETRLLSEARCDDIFYDLPEQGTNRLFHIGGHRREGMVMALGPHIKHVRLEGAQIADVPATTLALLGVPIPDDFDGRVLTEMLTPDVRLPGKSAAGDQGPAEGVFTPEEQAAVESRLKGLGYL